MIEELLKRAQIWVFDNAPGRGYATNWDYTKLSPELTGEVNEYNDSPKTKTIGPYVLNDEQRERVELGGRFEQWKTLDQIRASQPQFPEYVTKDQAKEAFILLSHGRLPNTNLYHLSEFFYTQKMDDKERPGTVYAKTILLPQTEHQVLLEHFRTTPKAAREVLARIAPGLTELRTLPEEVNRPILFTYVEY